MQYELMVLGCCFSFGYHIIYLEPNVSCLVTPPRSCRTHKVNKQGSVDNGLFAAERSRGTNRQPGNEALLKKATHQV